MDFARKQVKHFGYLFYFVSPNATTFDTVDDIPNYVNDVFPHFIFLAVLESLILRFRTENRYSMRLNDTMTSAGHGIIYTIVVALTHGVEHLGYAWVYERRFLDLDWNSPATWWITAVGIDLGYYWFHRLVHEVNLGWGAHQVHHSSEEYNLSTATRQSVFQKFFSVGIYLPLACIGVPFPAVLVHQQFNLLYQFWIHTEIVSTLGPLEWIFNTPSHHRVHHGSNPWCLDKNYAGVLIIWDRIFGTFEQERTKEKIIYGLVDQPQTFNIIWLQIFYYRDILRKAASQQTWSDTFKTLLFGPGWSKGSPRLGYPLPEPSKSEPPRKKYDPEIPFIVELYLVGHFIISLIVQQTLIVNLHNTSCLSLFLHMVYLLVTLGNIGAVYDGRRWAMVLEAVKCAVFVVFACHYSMFSSVVLDTVVTGYCALSAVAWTIHAVRTAGGSHGGSPAKATRRAKQH